MEKYKEFNIYYSDRKIPLVYTGRPWKIPLITVENYPKWYNLYLIMPNGKVEKDQRFHDFHESRTMINHCFDPEAIIDYVDLNDGAFDICGQSLELIVGRWELDINEKYRGSRFHTPSMFRFEARNN